MAKKNKKEKNYEEIDGVKYEVKDPKRKNIVKVYQSMVTNAHADYVAKHRMVEKRKKYAEMLFKNVARAPFTLGWLRWPEDENQKRKINGLEPIVEKKKKTTTRKRKSATKRSKKS